MESRFYEHSENENAGVFKDPSYPSFELMREVIRANREIDPALQDMLIMNMKEDARHYRETVRYKTKKVCWLHVWREWQLLIRLVLLMLYGIAIIYFSKGQTAGYLTSSMAVMGVFAFRDKVSSLCLFNKKK